MKINKLHRSNCSLIVTVGILLLSAVLSGVILYCSYNTTGPHSDTHRSSLETAPPRLSQNLGSQPEQDKDKKITHQIENPPTPSKNSLSGTISHQSISQGKLVLRTTINQVIPSGICKLSLKKSDQVFTEESAIIQNPSSSSCAGFVVATEKLSKGKWIIEIEIVSNAKRGLITGSVVL